MHQKLRNLLSMRDEPGSRKRQNSVKPYGLLFLKSKVEHFKPTKKKEKYQAKYSSVPA